MLDQVRTNKTKSRLLVSGFALSIGLVVTALLALIGALNPLGVLVGAVLVTAATSAAYWTSDVTVVRMSRAEPVSADAHPRYHNLVEGLCTASGLPKPRLLVLEDSAPNAFVTGRNPRNASVVVTTGLLQALNRVELEGVLAHELSHIKSYDIRPSTLAVTMLGPFVKVLPASAASRVLAKVINRDREALADVAAVEMTRYPPGLTDALEKLANEDTAVGSTSQAMAHLWLCGPTGLDERLLLLREL